MARQKTLYKLVGRYVRGNDTVYYGLISEDGKELLKCSPQAIGLIKILEGIETIKCNAFENCCDIESVVIPSSVKK